MARTSVLATLVLLFSLFTGFASANPGDAININEADVATLANLNGIGEAKAEAIISYREQNGPFATVGDLGNVKGIGTKTLETNAERLTVK